MRRLLYVLIAAALAAPAALAGGGLPDTVQAVPVRGQAVAGGLTLWVHVFPAQGARGKPSPPDICSDGNQETVAPLFARANATGLAFRVNDASIPIDRTAALQAIGDSFAAWDGATPLAYFSVSDTGGAARPAQDGVNSVGWAKLAPKSALAATWTWTDASGRIVEADVFFNSLHSWGVLSACGSASVYDVADVGTHEAGHTVGLDHLSDPGRLATMYPSAPRGEVRKRTLTTGDASGFLAAL